MKKSELTGAALAGLVAKCEGVAVTYDRHNRWYETTDPRYAEPNDLTVYDPTIYWEQGGPIIEREGLCLTPREYGWDAYVHANLFKEDGSDFFQMGPTPLIAAMRCYVASKLGDDIELPEELK